MLQVVCTERGVVPHGNSISGYDWRTHASSRWWSVARNHLSRPAYEHGAEQNWVQRETLTTDGSGEWGTATILSATASASASASASTPVGSINDDSSRPTTAAAGAAAAGGGAVELKLRWETVNTLPVVGTTLIVLDGPGVGQWRTITAAGPANGTVTIDRPFDGWVQHQQHQQQQQQSEETPALTASGSGSGTARGGASLVAVVSSFGSKIFAGNRFNWTEVVQW
jgi:hypothetical protein